MEKPLAWTELEAHFTRAMQQIADLAEEKERLQHVVLQLETENDTIGENSAVVAIQILILFLRLMLVFLQVIM